jgi:hypothetical protein
MAKHNTEAMKDRGAKLEISSEASSASKEGLCFKTLNE